MSLSRSYLVVRPRRWPAHCPRARSNTASRHDQQIEGKQLSSLFVSSAMLKRILDRVDAPRNRFISTSANCLSKPQDCDQVGPDHPVSHIRALRLHVREKETPREERLRLLRHTTNEFIHQFWEKHNKQFAEEKKGFVSSLKQDKEEVSAEDLSVFYKSFLDRKWGEHVQFNLEWQRRNFTIIGLQIMCFFEGLIKPKK